MKHFYITYVIKVDGKNHKEFKFIDAEKDFTLRNFVHVLVNEIRMSGVKVLASDNEAIVKSLETHGMVVLGKGVELKKIKITQKQEGEFLWLCPITRTKRLDDGTFVDVTKDEYEKYMKHGLFRFSEEWSPLAKEMASTSVTLVCSRCDSITMVTPESINKHVGDLDPPAQAGDWMDVFACPSCPDASEDRPGFKFTPVGDDYEKHRFKHIEKFEQEIDAE